MVSASRWLGRIAPKSPAGTTPCRQDGDCQRSMNISPTWRCAADVAIGVRADGRAAMHVRVDLDEMANGYSLLDWNDVRFFLAIARNRTIARAGRLLGVDQSTVGRRLSSLERRLGVALFVRSAAGFQLTPSGSRMLQSAERMQEAAEELASEAA